MLHRRDEDAPSYFSTKLPLCLHIMPSASPHHSYDNKVLSIGLLSIISIKCLIKLSL